MQRLFYFAMGILSILGIRIIVQPKIYHSKLDFYFDFTEIR